MRGSKSQLGFQFVKTEGAKPDAPEEIKRVVEDIDEQTCMLRRVDQLGGMFSCSFCAKEIQSRRTKGANRTKLNTSGVVRHLLNFCRNFRTKHQAAMDWLLAKREMIPKSGRKTSEQGALMARTMATQLVPAVQPTPNAIAVPLYSNLPQAGGNLERLQQALWELFGDLSIVLIVVSYVDGSFSVPVINDSRKLGLPTAGLFQPNLQPTMPMTADIYTNPPGTTSILSGPSVNVTGVHVPGINVPGVVSGVVPVNVPEHEHSGTLSTSQLQSSQLSPQLTQVELQALINAQIPNAPMPNAQMSNAPISNTTMPNVPVSTPTIPGEVEVLNAVELSSQPAPAPSPTIPIERAMVCPFCREAVHMPPNAPWMHTCLQSKNAPLLDPGLDHRMPCPMLNCSKLIKTFRHQTLKSDMYKHIQVVHSAALKNGLKIEDVKRVVRFWLECHGLRKKSRKGSGFNLPGEPNVREMKTSRANTSSNTLMPRAAKRRKINPRSKQEPRECLELIYPKNARFSAGQFFNPDISLKMKKLGIPSETEPVVAELRLGSFPPFKCNTLSTIDGCLWVKIGDQKDFVRTVQNVFNDTAKQCASVYPLEVEWSFEVRLKQMGQELTSYTIVINAGKVSISFRFVRGFMLDSTIGHSCSKKKKLKTERPNSCGLRDSIRAWIYIPVTHQFSTNPNSPKPEKPTKRGNSPYLSIFWCPMPSCPCPERCRCRLDRHERTWRSCQRLKLMENS
uniref:Uncharacterized protein n=1 Tax=Lotharella globosa TaxID=91324 RepID=A0A7S4DUP2_9EUKA